MQMQDGHAAGQAAKPGWGPWLAWAALWLLSAAAADRFICNGPASPAPVQAAIALGFGLLTCRGLLLAAEAAALKRPGGGWHDWPCYVPAAVFALLWGRHNFLDFFYYDEFNRFWLLYLSPSQLPKELFVPVNDHLQPVAKLYWYVIYSVFRSNYIGVAAGAFVCAVACLAGAFALVRLAAPGDPRRLPLVLATLLAATPHSPYIILWKGAGDSVLLTLTFFFPTLVVLARVIDGRQPPGPRAFALFLAGTVLTTFSSSLVTLVPVYLLPFGLWLYLQPGPKRDRVRFFTAAFAGAVAATLLYWALRRYVAKVALPHPEWRWKNFLGSLRGALELYFHWRVLTGLFLAGSAAAGGRLLLTVFRKAGRSTRTQAVRADPAAVVWALGFLMFVVGTFQLTAARHMTYESREEMSFYHLFLTNWGLGLACVGLAGVAANGWAGLAARAPRPVLPRRARGLVRAAACAGAAAYCVWQGARLNQAWPVLTAFPLRAGMYPFAAPLPAGLTRISVIRDRAEFAADLRRFLEGAARAAPRDERHLAVLPDLAVADSPRFVALALWPAYLNTHPQHAPDWIAASRLSFHLRVTGLDAWVNKRIEIRFIPLEAVPPGTLRALLNNPETGVFLHKYWPDLHPPSAS
jgi:hypothetical protein